MKIIEVSSSSLSYVCSTRQSIERSRQTRRVDSDPIVVSPASDSGDTNCTSSALIQHFGEIFLEFPRHPEKTPRHRHIILSTKTSMVPTYIPRSGAK